MTPDEALEKIAKLVDPVFELGLRSLTREKILEILQEVRNQGIQDCGY